MTNERLAKTWIALFAFIVTWDVVYNETPCNNHVDEYTGENYVDTSCPHFLDSRKREFSTLRQAFEFVCRAPGYHKDCMMVASYSGRTSRFPEKFKIADGGSVIYDDVKGWSERGDK